jgi:hypothetical protein
MQYGFLPPFLQPQVLFTTNEPQSYVFGGRNHPLHSTSQQLLHEHHAKQSFSHPGKPHDNAVAESFFASLKKEELYRKALPSDRAFQASVASYINFLDTKRPHCTLKNLTQCQMEENFIVDTK